MSNPQDNPGTPPPPSPSGSSTPPPPSTNPQPKKRCVKMLARKIVASGPGSSDSEKTQNPPSKVSSALAENLENRFVLVRPIRDLEMPELGRSGAICGFAHATVEESGKKSRGSGSGEAAEGLVNLSAQADEPGSSIEETLPDLIKKVGASYNPMKRRTPTPKAPSAAKPSKKRKASSPTTTEIPFPKERATKSRVKQSESDLQKALAESKKKRMDKGKGKVAESSEAVDVEEVEQVHQEDHTTKEV
uniref:Protein enabled homolog n=1 Tax=Nicotiana tabacum TaxID=4097 RepID=A0A1S4D6H0_TOBAC|nr:PREDICTED: protein enabled homolog [Nicotiana tabacum]